MSVRVVCDDTEIFCLLVHYYNSRCKCGNSDPMIMSTPVKERALICILATVESHSDVADDLLPIHALSGTDAVASLHGIGKATTVKVAKKGCFTLLCIVVMCMLRLNMLRHRPLNACVLHMAR